MFYQIRNSPWRPEQLRIFKVCISAELVIKQNADSKVLHVGLSSLQIKKKIKFSKNLGKKPFGTDNKYMQLAVNGLSCVKAPACCWWRRFRPIATFIYGTTWNRLSHFAKYVAWLAAVCMCVCVCVLGLVLVLACRAACDLQINALTTLSPALNAPSVCLHGAGETEWKVLGGFCISSLSGGFLLWSKSLGKAWSQRVKTWECLLFGITCRIGSFLRHVENSSKQILV